MIHITVNRLDLPGTLLLFLSVGSTCNIGPLRTPLDLSILCVFATLWDSLME